MHAKHLDEYENASTPVLLPDNAVSEGTEEFSTPLSVWWTRRILDIVFSLTGLILALPIILVAAAFSKRATGLSVVYAQKRGCGQERYVMCKIRTMDINGNVVCPKMRKFRIDELLQFWYVLIGVISMVGLRDLRTCEEAHILKSYPEEHWLRSTKRGLTGEIQLDKGDRLSQHALYEQCGWNQRQAEQSVFTYVPYYLWQILRTPFMVVSGLVSDKNGDQPAAETSKVAAE